MKEHGDGRGPERPIRTVLSAKTLAAIDKVKTEFGVDYSVISDEGQPYTTRQGVEATVSQGYKQVELVSQPNQDLGPFWRKVDAVRSTAPQKATS